MKRTESLRTSVILKKSKCNSDRKKRAISEIIGTILLLSISITLLSAFYIIVLHSASSPSNTFIPSANIVGEVQGKNIILEHRGGVSVNRNSTITVIVAGTPYRFIVKNNLIDTNGDGKWSIGERVIFTPPGYSTLTNLEISLVVVDPSLNIVLMHSVIQEGESGATPYVQTMDPLNVMPHFATIKSYYNYLDSSYLPGKVWFQWRRSDNSSWNTTVPVSVAAGLTGYAQVNLTGLTNNQNYLFQSWIQYNDHGKLINKSGTIQLFTTLIDTMGQWHFDETSGVKVFDSSGQIPPNDGTLSPNIVGGPQRLVASLNHSLNCLSFDGINDNVVIPSSPTLCLTDQCSLEAWVNRSSHCSGLIGIPTSPSLKLFNTFYKYGCLNPNIIPVKGSIYAIVSTNETSPNPGYLITVNISSSGIIVSNDTTCIVDLFQFSASCKTPKIISISGSAGIYGIVYTMPNTVPANKLYLITVKIYNNGTINKTIISSRQLNTFTSAFPDIIQITGSTNGYAIIYGVNATIYGRMLSINISAAGIISPVNKVFVFRNETNQETYMNTPEIIPIVGSFNNYVIVYNCNGDDGGIRTTKITNTGVISNISREMKFDEDDGGDPDIFYVNNGYYAIVYAGPAGRITGALKTVKINAAGTITPKAGNIKVTKVYSTTFFESSPGRVIRSPHIIAVDPSNDIFAITYEIDAGGGLSYGRMKTLQLDDFGHFVQFIDALTFESYYAVMPDFIQISSNVYGIVYQSDVSDGILKTVKINIDGTIPIKPIINMYELGTFNCYEESALLTSDNQYVASVFRTVDRSLVLKTVKVNTTSKSIANYFSSTLLIEPGNISSKKPNNASYMPVIIPINGNVYALIYCQYLDYPVSVRRGKICTINIDSNGQISPIMNRTFDNTFCTNTPMDFIAINKTNGIYAIVYQLTNNTGRVTTVKILSNGNIIGFPGSYRFEATYCKEPSIVRVSGNVYAIAYRDVNNYGKLITLKIFSDGSIPLKVNDTYQFVSASCFHPKIIQTNGNIFALVYSLGGSNGYVVTVNISANGVIVKSIIGSLQFVSSNGYQPYIFPVYERVYAIIYQSSVNSYGWITTIRIGENGDIISSVDSTSQIYPSFSSPTINSYDMKMIPFTSTNTARYYIVTVGGKNMDLYMSVICINISGTKRNIMSKQGAYTLQANGTMVFANITDANNQKYILSGRLKNGWNHIICTYTTANMILYINGTQVNSTSVNGKYIKNTANQLLFGEYNAIYDEFAIYATALSQSRIMDDYNYYRKGP